MGNIQNQKYDVKKKLFKIQNINLYTGSLHNNIISVYYLYIIFVFIKNNYNVDETTRQKMSYIILLTAVVAYKL